ncbi:hypothetical protein YC2023_024467 [Brassica napus]
MFTQRIDSHSPRDTSYTKHRRFFRLIKHHRLSTSLSIRFNPALIYVTSKTYTYISPSSLTQKSISIIFKYILCLNKCLLGTSLVGVAQGFSFPSIHTVLAQWVPPHERSRLVSITTSGMYLGAALGMWLLPALVELRGPESVFLAETLAGVIWSLLWIRYATDPTRSEHPKAAAAGFGGALLPTNVNQHKVTHIPWKKIMFSLPRLGHRG